MFNAEFGRPERATFAIDRAGVIRWRQVYPTGELPDNSQVLEALREIEKSNTA